MTANFRRRLIQVIVSAAILGGAVFLAMQIFSNPPKAEKKKMNKRSLVTVEVKKLATEPYRVRLQSYGKLQAKSSGSVAAQVSGVITELGDHVLVGSFFKKDELLFRIDDRDYRAALKIAEADLALAQAKLVEEQAKGEQARRNWQRLKGRESAGDLVLRKPYLASAEAAVKGAEARRDQAALDLERTAIRAPYDGRILAKNVDIGQFVSKSMVVAEIYNTHSLELRLPLSQERRNLIDLPEQASQSSAGQELPLVEISSSHNSKNIYKGRLIRVEAEVDRASQQLFVVAELREPYKETTGESQLRLGQFVQATIHGKLFDAVFRIPSHALYTGDEVFLFKNNMLQRQSVTVLNREGDFVVISHGLEPGELLVTTPLGSVVSGTRARLAGKAKRHQ